MSVISLFLVQTYVRTVADKKEPRPPAPSPAAVFSEKTGAEPIDAPIVKKVNSKLPFPVKKPLSRKPLPPNVTRVTTNDMNIAITFDGGSDADDADVILKTLKEKGIRTTIFLTGMFIERYPDMVKRMVEDGHEIGNHTMNHPHLTDYAKTFRNTALPGVTREFLAKELGDTAGLFEKLAGRRMSPLWRAPYGEINGEIQLWAYKEGYIHVGWTSDYKTKTSLDSLDWVVDDSSKYYLSSAGIKERILNFGHDGDGLRGAIILMHLSTERTVDRVSERLGEIIDALREKGYSFVKVSELIKEDKRLRAFFTGGSKEVAMLDSVNLSATSAR